MTRSGQVLSGGGAGQEIFVLVQRSTQSLQLVAVSLTGNVASASLSGSRFRHQCFADNGQLLEVAWIGQTVNIGDAV